MKQKRYDSEFKKDIVKLYLSGTRTCPSLAMELGLHENTIYKWIQQYKNDPEHAFPGSGNLKPEDDELKNALRKVKELETEIEILKRAAVYFAKNSK